MAGRIRRTCLSCEHHKHTPGGSNITCSIKVAGYDKVPGLVEFIRQKHCRPCLMAAGGYRCSTHCEGCDIWELTKEAKP